MDDDDEADESDPSPDFVAQGLVLQREVTYEVSFYRYMMDGLKHSRKYLKPLRDIAQVGGAQTFQHNELGLSSFLAPQHDDLAADERWSVSDADDKKFLEFRPDGLHGPDELWAGD